MNVFLETLASSDVFFTVKARHVIIFIKLVHKPVLVVKILSKPKYQNQCGG
jgi:hypothetical protein